MQSNEIPLFNSVDLATGHVQYFLCEMHFMRKLRENHEPLPSSMEGTQGKLAMPKFQAPCPKEIEEIQTHNLPKFEGDISHI